MLFCSVEGGADLQLGMWQCMWHGKSQFTVGENFNHQIFMKVTR